MGILYILVVTVLVKQIKGTAHQCYGNDYGVVRCERTFYNVAMVTLRVNGPQETNEYILTK